MSLERVDEVYPERRLQFGQVVRLDGSEIPARLLVAAHHQMLAVVNDTVGRFVDERIGSTAEVLLLFQEEYLFAMRREFDGSAQSAHSSADYDDVVPFLVNHGSNIQKRGA